MREWTRGEKIGCWGTVVGTVTCLAVLSTIPSFQGLLPGGVPNPAAQRGNDSGHTQSQIELLEQERKLLDEQTQAMRQEARNLYEETYREWLAPLAPWQRSLQLGLRDFVIFPAYSLARRAGRPLEQRWGYTERDWTNMLRARYISKLDLWRNRRNPYYLVQSIPARARRAGAEPSA